MGKPQFLDQLSELIKGEIRQELAFTRSEYDQRVAAIRGAMDERGIDVLLSTYLPNLCYITGYQFTNCDYSGYLLLPMEGTATMVVPGTEVSTVLLHGWVRDVLDFPSWKPHEAAPLIGNKLKELGLSSGTIGIEQRFELMDSLILEQIQALVPEAKLVDASDLVIEFRRTKSPAELHHLRQAGRYTDVGMLAARAATQPGNTENDVAAAMVCDMIEVGSEFFSTAPTVAAGSRTAILNAMFKRNEIAKGDAVKVQLAGVHQRYSTPLLRTFLTGSHSSELSRQQSSALECMQLIEAGVKPGVRIGDVASKAVGYLQRTSATQVRSSKSFGHGIGVGMPPSWMEEWLEIREDNDHTFEVGMTFHSSVNLSVSGKFGYGVGNSWVVTTSGVEFFTKLPHVL